MTVKLKGTAASDGIAIADVYLLAEPDLSFQKGTVQNPDNEKPRLHDALSATKADLALIREKAAEKMGEEEAKIFDAHQLLLQDPELIQTMETAIEQEKVNAETALWEATDTFIDLFESMEDNAYMRERAADIRDVRKRVLSHLLGVEFPDPANIRKKVILAAEDLSPSDTAQLDKNYIMGFVTSKGGSTSHSAIMARSLEIPAVVGVPGLLEKISQNDLIVLDGSKGEVFLSPDESMIQQYRDQQQKYDNEKTEWQKLLLEPSLTKDGVQVELAANIGTVKDLEGAKSNGAESIGLFRTEFLYMDSSELPDEEYQFEVYKKVLTEMEDKTVVVRTMDIGGDKKLPYLDIPEEMNPFLGYRAIRMCLEDEGVFRPQIRALLRASVYGKLAIMFPMIATLEELRQAKKIVEEEKSSLLNENIEVSDHIEIGIMVETPAAALIADQFSKEVDFFSIGTNDLIQYTMAADRMNEKVSYLYQPYHPAVLRLVKQVIDAGHKEGCWVGMCGEMAGDPIAVPLLVGLGLDEYSMSATSILRTRSQLKTLNSVQMRKMAQRALDDCATASEVADLVQKEIANEQSEMGE